MENKIKSFLNSEIRIETIINILLYSVIIIMPFIVSKNLFPQYVLGKKIYLYIIGLSSLIIILYLRPRKFSKEELVAFIFLITIIVPTIFSPVREIAIYGNALRGEGAIIFCVYIMLFFLSKRYLILNKKTLNMVLISASIMGIYSILQYYGFDPIQKWMFGYISRVSAIGLIGNRNFLSSYVCIFLFISMAIYILKGGVKYLLYSSVLFASLICSLTRGGWVGFLIYSLIGLSFIIKDKKRLKKAIIVFSVFLSIFVVLNTVSANESINRARKTIYVDKNSKDLVIKDSGRIEIIKIALKVFKDSPLIGWGPDTLMYRLNLEYSELQSNYISKNKSYIDKVHNEFLEYAVCNGVFSLISYLVLIGLIIHKLIKEIKYDKSKIILLTLIGYLVQSFFNISVIMVAPIYWIFLGFSLQKIEY